MKMPGGSSEWGPLNGASPAYRLLGRPGDIADKATGRIHFKAFARRSGNYPDGREKDAVGVSVELLNGREESQLVAERFSPGSSFKCRGIARILVSSVRAISFDGPLDVEQDALQHANIIGIPRQLPDDGDENNEGKAFNERVQHLLTQLAEASVLVGLNEI